MESVFLLADHGAIAVENDRKISYKIAILLASFVTDGNPSLAVPVI